MNTRGDGPAQGGSLSSVQAAVTVAPTDQDEWTVDRSHRGRASHPHSGSALALRRRRRGGWRKEEDPHDRAAQILGIYSIIC